MSKHNLTPEQRERVTRLVAALRSGEFKQAREKLRDAHEDSYCCLGVACELYRRETGHGDWEGGEYRHGEVFDEDDCESDASDAELTRFVNQWYGFRSVNPKIDGAKAIERNDQMGQSFAEIADAFEKEYLAEAST